VGCEVCKHVDVAYFTGSPAEAREALGIGAEHIAEPIGDPDLTIGAQQSPIVFRLPVQPDGIVGVVLIERGHHAGAVFPQILGDFHRLTLPVNGRLRAPGSPMPSASS